jgi:hypothetical protein
MGIMAILALNTCLRVLTRMPLVSRGLVAIGTQVSVRLNRHQLSRVSWLQRAMTGLAGHPWFVVFACLGIKASRWHSGNIIGTKFTNHAGRLAGKAMAVKYSRPMVILWQFLQVPGGIIQDRRRAV